MKIFMMSAYYIHLR